ncbi:MAG: hypothetical protein JETCAE03_33840 [Ignavibacteriaceae bacterium]|jgi:hypothetical protein|nr:MAG: hypothetical protein JETCAE03_33840 [Ignavibacteriaceae bacterium]
MARIKRQKTYQGLHTIPVYKTDVNNEIFNAFGMPEVFPRGKSYFLILGSDQLVQGSDLLIEILDKDGNVVYNEIPVYAESSARAISVWIYSGNARGEAQITILGQLENVPLQWKNKYNVKITIPVVINPNLTNNQPIRFETDPIVSASIADRAYLFVTESVTTLQTFNSAFYQAVGEYNESSRQYAVNLFTLALPPIAPPTFPDGRFHASNLTVDGVAFTSSYSASYTLIDAEHFIVDPPPFVYEKLKGTKSRYWTVYETVTDGKGSSIPKYIYNFDSTYSWSLQYQITDTGSITPLTASFAKIDFHNLQTFSGKIDSLKVYKKNLTSDTSYVLMGEFPAEPNELFVSRSKSIDNFIGQFTSEDWVNLNWTSASETGGALAEAAHVKQSDLNLYNSLYLSQSEARHEIFKVYPKNTKIQFYGDAEYTITTQIVGCPLNDTNAEMNIYMSGSAFYHTVLDDQLGKLVANVVADKFTNFGERIFNFIADNTNTGTIVFEIVSGKWNVSNISIQAAYDEGFNADDLQLYIPLDNVKRDEIVNFRIEFLNSKRESSPTKIETIIPILLKNNPVYIEKDDNVISGSLSIGSSAKTGLVMAGNDSPTFKSTGYEGFNLALVSGAGGFAFYSGSPEELSQSYNAQNYAGVGFELHTGDEQQGSLAFRYSEPTGSYLIITASIYALPGSNVVNATGSGGGGGGTGSSLWTESADGTYISRLGDVKISGSLYLSKSLYDAYHSSGSEGYFLTSDQTGKVQWLETIKAPNFLGIAVSNEYSPITSSATYVAMYMPHDFTLLDIKASLSLTGSADLTLDVLQNGVSLLGGNYVTISGSVHTGSIDAINTALLTDDRIDIQVITDGSGSSGLKVYLVGSSSISYAESTSFAISASYASSASFIDSASWAAFAVTASYLLGATSGLWTASVDGTYISRESNVQISGSLDVRDSFYQNNVGESFFTLVDTAYISASSDVQIGKLDGGWIRVLPVAGTITISGSNIVVNNQLLDIGGSTHIGSLSSHIHQITGSLLITGSEVITGSLDILGNTVADGNVFVDGLLTASGQVYAKDGLIVDGGITSSDENLLGGLRVVKNTILGDQVGDRVEVTASMHFGDGGASGSLYGTSSWAISASWAPSTGGGSSATGSFASQSFTNQATWSFAHNLGYQYPSFEIYDTNDQVIIPENIIASNANLAVIYFPVTQSGLATATYGGNIIETASYAITASFALNGGGGGGGTLFTLTSSNGLYYLTASTGDVAKITGSINQYYLYVSDTWANLGKVPKWGNLYGEKARFAADMIQDKSDGNAITFWRDLSGNEYTMVAQGSGPIYSEAIINGLPAVEFIGAAASNMRISGWVAGNDLISSSLTAYVVCNNISGSTRAILSARPTTSTGWTWRYNSVSQSAYFHLGGNTMTGSVAPGWRINWLRRSGLQIQIGTEQSMSYDGTSSAAYISNSVDSFTQVGSEAGASSLFGGYIAEIIMFDSVISGSLHDQIILDLRTKYNI